MQGGAPVARKPRMASLSCAEHFLRRDEIRLQVTMAFGPDGLFRVQYEIANQGHRPFAASYAMVGFPGSGTFKRR